jgi:hypothetical protein
MNGSLPDPVPPGARLGLDDADGLAPMHLAALAPEAAMTLAQQALVHGLLPLALEDDAGRRAFTARITVAIVPEATAFTRQVVDHLHPRTRSGPLAGTTPAARSAAVRGWRLARVCAALAAGLLVVVLAGRSDGMVATLVRSESAAWDRPVAALVPGSRLRLSRGLAEFDLQGRGRLVLEGPADLEFAGETRAILRSGRLVLNATVRGHGYRIETPSGALVDLGTRFGVEVTADGATEAHVIEGSIAAIPDPGMAEVILHQRDAARLTAGRIERVAADPGAFYTSLPPHDGTRPEQLCWHLDEGAGTSASAEVRGFAGLATALHLRSVRGAPLPSWVPGRHGTALAFDGRGGYAESAFPGIAGSQARTMACWVRMPRDFTPADGFAMVSWGNFTSAAHGAVWQVSLNPLAHDGPLGRIRVGTHGGLLVGTTDLRDDAWHHIAVVMYGGARPDIGTHVLVYLDGELEAISRRTLRAIDTRIGEGGHGVWLGRNITHMDETKPHPSPFLRGMVDEMVIANGALSQLEIRTLMEGRPPASGTP